MARQHGLDLTTVRPCTIYGAFDPNFTPVFRRLPLTVMPAFLRLSLVYAGDVAEAIALALERPASVGKAYNTAGEGESFWELARAWQEAGGRTAAAMLPLPVPFRMRFDSSRARTELGWRTRPMAEALRETFRLERGAWERTRISVLPARAGPATSAARRGPWGVPPPPSTG